MTKTRLVSGITATGNLTIGNYLGAIKQIVKYQKDYEVIVFAANLHSLTIDVKPEDLRKNTKNIIAMYLAVGLDPKKSILFVQSDVPAHAELAWVMTTKTTMGELSRMTQFKDKSSKVKVSNGTSMIPTGLFTYPTLMAADILLYLPDIVPVGKDQKQHLELTQSIAHRFNEKYGKTFKIPQISLVENGNKIMSLIEPTQKMSKSSDNPRSYISLFDEPEVAIKKIKSAITDSEGKIYISKDKPGISNLLQIYAGFKDVTLKQAEMHFKNKDYAQLKEEVANVVGTFLKKIQTEYAKKLPLVDKIIKDGAQRANTIANITLEKVYKKIGIK